MTVDAKEKSKRKLLENNKTIIKTPKLFIIVLKRNSSYLCKNLVRNSINNIIPVNVKSYETEDIVNNIIITSQVVCTIPIVRDLAETYTHMLNKYVMNETKNLSCSCGTYILYIAKEV